ncbi:hypothetical protein [Variovorax ginsengisoli]|uniref:DNA-binding protein n=1 Tax=Variovorax ginsengisoli TaxID=363844 RepID=A0ABT8S7C5_9BURK|nr:hypothetical protein [Variovorax ginsengisoli]MDN8615490.1 hypothetical protein [Variovorax ginsengisoli]MDO1534660.1 hypothetical protein [Variovorax ginsengisoli]
MTDDLEARIQATEQALRAAVERAGAFVSGDGRVHEEVAAPLLGIAPGTLANQRRAGTGPAFYRVSGRPTYRLRDLAETIERGRCVPGW